MKSYLYNRSFQVKVGCSATNFYPDKGTAGICAQPYTILYILFTTHLSKKPVNTTATYTDNTAALVSLRVSKIIVQMRYSCLKKFTSFLTSKGFLMNLNINYLPDIGKIFIVPLNLSKSVK